MINSNKGVTVLELAIGILLISIVMSAAFSLYLTQHKQLIVQDEISDVQAAIRAASDELASKIRLAGYDLPRGVPAIQAYNSNPDTIALAYASLNFNGVQTEHDMADPSSPLLCDGHDLSNLKVSDIIYIMDPAADTSEYLQVTGVDTSTSSIQHGTMALSRTYPAGSKLLKIMHYKYYIDQSDTNHPNLICQINSGTPEVFAENITDLQFKYCLTSPVVVDVPLNDKMIREVQITVKARADNPDPDFQNRYRYRSIKTRVKVRNLRIN
jgi:Tfp pilus assembly protein PilW